MTAITIFGFESTTPFLDLQDLKSWICEKLHLDIGSSYSNSVDLISPFKFTDENIALNESDSIASATLDSLKNRALFELEQYKNFKPGWDGYFAKTFNDEVVDYTKTLLGNVCTILQENDLAPDEISPGPGSDGSVDLEFGLGSDCIILTIEHDLSAITLYIEEERDPDRSVEFQYKLQ